ncbi:hypothetical protein CspeluHIS016_0211590 [Cutaneotrichosporon spelunceum]|uniref:Uncharacterized protein n=1 Tax=Cutaneotrichosporon spelunceum TaxID=1672016 RepID=A0AAD3TSY4_9TREE|nr:hypothetical protein CspeluHIS016_0211590 [Cutaneotrichosporon spelunceum]
MNPGRRRARTFRNPVSPKGRLMAYEGLGPNPFLDAESLLSSPSEPRTDLDEEASLRGIGSATMSRESSSEILGKMSLDSDKPGTCVPQGPTVAAEDGQSTTDIPKCSPQKGYFVHVTPRTPTANRRRRSTIVASGFNIGIPILPVYEKGGSSGNGAPKASEPSDETRSKGDDERDS